MAVDAYRAGLLDLIRTGKPKERAEAEGIWGDLYDDAPPDDPRGPIADPADAVRAKTSPYRAALIHGGSGALGGFLDEIGGGIAAGLSKVGLWDTGEVPIATTREGVPLPGQQTRDNSAAGIYRDVRGGIRQDLKDTAEDHREIAIAADIGGSLLSPLGKVGGAAKGIGGVMRAGAIQGGIAGFGNSDADVTRGEIGDAALDTAIGSGVGGLASGVLTGGARAIKWASPRVRDYLKAKAAGIFKRPELKAVGEAHGGLGVRMAAENAGAAVVKRDMAIVADQIAEYKKEIAPFLSTPLRRDAALAQLKAKIENNLDPRNGTPLNPIKDRAYRDAAEFLGEPPPPAPPPSFVRPDQTPDMVQESLPTLGERPPPPRPPAPQRVLRPDPVPEMVQEDLPLPGAPPREMYSRATGYKAGTLDPGYPATAPPEPLPPQLEMRHRPTTDEWPPTGTTASVRAPTVPNVEQRGLRFPTTDKWDPTTPGADVGAAPINPSPTLDTATKKLKALREQAAFESADPTDVQLAAQEKYMALRGAIEDSIPEEASAVRRKAAGNAAETRRRRDILGNTEGPLGRGGKGAPDETAEDVADIFAEPDLRVSKEKAIATLLGRVGDENVPGDTAAKYLKELEQDPAMAFQIALVRAKKAQEAVRLSATGLSPLSLTGATAGGGFMPIVSQNLRFLGAHVAHPALEFGARRGAAAIGGAAAPLLRDPLDALLSRKRDKK